MREWGLGDMRARRVYLLLAIILLGWGLRLYRIGAFGWWDGEPHTILHSLHPLTELPFALRDFAAHPPLWYVLTHFLLYLGSNETLLRLPAVLVGVLSIPVIYLLGEHLFGNAEGLLASFLLAISPMAVRWSQSVRMYSAMLLFSVLSLYFILRALREGKAIFWAGFALSTLLNLYNHYFVLFVLFSEVAYAWIVILSDYRSSRRKGRRAYLEQKESETGIVSSAGHQAFFLLATLLFIALCYLPWLPIMRVNFLSRQAERESIMVWSEVQVDLPFLRALFGDFSGTYGLGLIVFGSLFLMGLFALPFRNRWRSFLLALIWLIPPFLVIALIAPRRFHAKYLIFVLPLYLLLVSSSLVELCGALGDVLRKWFQVTKKWGKALDASIALLCLGMVAIPDVVLLAHYFDGNATAFESSTEPKEIGYRAHWGNLWGYLNGRAKPGDFILVVPGQAFRARPSLLVYLRTNRELATVFGSLTPAQRGSINVWWVGQRGRLANFQPPMGYEVASLIKSDSIGLLGTTTRVRWASPGDINLGFERDDGTDYEGGDREAGNGVPDGWTVVRGRDTIRLDTSMAVEGKQSLVISSGGKAWVVMTSSAFTVQPEKPFRLTSRVKGGVWGYYEFWPRFALLFFNENDEPVNSPITPLLFEASSIEGWRSIVVEGITPPQAAYGLIKINSGPHLGTYSPLTWIDDIQLQVGEGY